MERNGDITFPIPEHVAALRRRNFHTHVNAWVDMGTVTGRNQDAVKKTVAGMLKLLHPHRARWRAHRAPDWPARRIRYRNEAAHHGPAREDAAGRVLTG